MPQQFHCNGHTVAFQEQPPQTAAEFQGSTYTSGYMQGKPLRGSIGKNKEGRKGKCVGQGGNWCGREGMCHSCSGMSQDPIPFLSPSLSLCQLHYELAKWLAQIPIQHIPHGSEIFSFFQTVPIFKKPLEFIAYLTGGNSCLFVNCIFWRFCLHKVDLVFLILPVFLVFSLKLKHNTTICIKFTQLSKLLI